MRVKFGKSNMCEIEKTNIEKSNMREIEKANIEKK